MVLQHFLIPFGVSETLPGYVPLSFRGQLLRERSQRYIKTNCMKGNSSDLIFFVYLFNAHEALW